MKAKNIFLSFVAVASLMGCDKFLDKMPDNRAEVDTPAKVRALLVSAYATKHFQLFAEMYSDNADDNAKVVSNASPGRYYEQIWNWQDITETANDSPDNVWTSNWSAIAAANQALEAIEDLGGKNDPDLSEPYGEALICRAYAHFTLVNLFCLNYNAATSATDQGIPYMEKPEQGLSPKYERGNVAEVYEKIERDLEEGLKYVGDNYTVPKYHFTRQAAYAFATRFYLFYEKWDKAIEAANNCLGNAPQSLLRDNADLQKCPDIATATVQYVSSNEKANLLLQTNMSTLARYQFRNYGGQYKRFAFTTAIAETEVMMAKHPWTPAGVTTSAFIFRPRNYDSSNLHYTLFWKVPGLFEYTDPVAGRGYAQTIVPTFTVEDVLLERAEAYVMLRDYDKACNDLNLWINNMYDMTRDGVTFVTPESIEEFYQETKTKYYTWEDPTDKKHLNPAFAIDAEGSMQESMIHAVLNAKRIENLFNGLRWFDIKRYGIEIVRRHVDDNAHFASISDTMTKDDLRRAFQVPQKARDAGFEPTKREKK